jgi:hypothetical protein
MVERTRATYCVALLALAGCYDLERLDPGPERPYLLIDDFEDGDAEPSAPSFENWMALPFKSGDEASTSIAIVDSDLDGGLALLGEFVFDDLNGDFTGASLGIGNARNPLDVRRYRAIHVTWRFQPGPLALPPTTRFYAELQCNAAPPLGDVQSPFWVQLAMPVSSDWKALRLDLAFFNEPTPEQPRIAGGPKACLATVDAIRFTIATSLGTLSPRGGSVYIDDVYFE